MIDWYEFLPKPNGVKSRTSFKFAWIYSWEHGKGKIEMSQVNESYRKIKSRVIRIKLIDKTFISGQVNINRDDTNEYERLSDLLTKNPEKFLVVFSATELRDDLDQGIKHKTLFINKDHILWVMPEEDQR